MGFQIIGGSRKYTVGYIITILSTVLVLNGFMSDTTYAGFLTFIWGGILGIDQRRKEADGCNRNNNP